MVEICLMTIETVIIYQILQGVISNIEGVEVLIEVLISITLIHFNRMIIVEIDLKTSPCRGKGTVIRFAG